MVQVHRLNEENTFFLAGPDDTRRFGRLLGRCLKPGSVVALIGNLGAGKTCLTQGLAHGLNVPREFLVVSPSFTLANEYPGDIPLFHLDVYRLEKDDFYEAGLDEYFTRDGVVAVEWADKIEALLPRPYLEVQLTLAFPEGRLAVVRPHGEELDQIIKTIREDW